MKLDEYLKFYEISETDFGKLIGVAQPVVNRWRNGRSFPKWENIPKIVWATGGEVRAEDFVQYEMFSQEDSFDR